METMLIKKLKYIPLMSVVALSEFNPNFYDLLLVDINMPHMNRFELSERILAIDINVRICFTSRDHRAIDGVKLKLNSNFFVLILR